MRCPPQHALPQGDLCGMPRLHLRAASSLL
jgi:hypothetical protein